ncbi:LamG-like jellyroll fold domain-containing protein [Saccharothrix syringae]|uniref:Glycoside hydrolase family 2 n=1 Tax=Saccharothrix syringae TaxID=103733 RepID=A0A5Q0H1V0_SACSY|nr:LamG-like jellyroll fold domain-containing protein [Saccharothrix syringae]QFZ20178.1 glycoside hydrolase family 2 [Saccharothrix syringae]
MRPAHRLLTLLLSLFLLPAIALPAGAEPDRPGRPDPAPPVHGLKGEYFRMSAPGARDFAEPGGTSLDPDINFTDLTSTFAALTGRTEHTTARWTGRLTAPATGDYTFHAIGDNGFRLFLDGTPVIDHWVGDWDVEQHSAPIHLEAGREHDFRLELFQDVGGANMYLRWSTPTAAKRLVPETAFLPPADFPVYPVRPTTTKDRLELDFDRAVNNIGSLTAHLRVDVDTVPFPLGKATLARGDRTKVVVELAAPVQEGQRVRVTYDGAAGLTAGGEAVPEIVRTATNTSTHRLTTPWGDDLDTDHPLPEYPRPQQVREDWVNLNGPWEFAAATAGQQPEFGRALPERIIVPFPVESQLSGLERHEDHMFYRRQFTVPGNWRIGRGERLKLNFGAVDHSARVWVDGTQVAEHTGGYTSFTADITDALRGRGRHELVVAVTDTTGDNQPIGKQSRNPGGIVYTQSSGIWQTVWLEPVPDKAIDDVKTTPDITAGTLAVRVSSTTASAAATVRVTARDHRGRQVGAVTGRPNTDLTLPVPGPHLWTPEDPYLYDLDVSLVEGSSRDSVKSYFGMRSVDVQDVGGFPKLVLNGKPVFSLAMLDQGFWPDGLNTAPSDEALLFDLKAQKDLGFNAVRKHIKVEPARWYYHADRLGLLVWQDFVNVNVTDQTGQEAFLTEGRRAMEQVHDSPAVIGWVVFNEGWGEWDREATGRIAESVRAADPSRVVNAHSGVNCCASKGDSGKGDVIDHHDYVNNDAPWPDATRAAMDGEHGGFTLRTPGHQWPGAPAVIYSGVADKAALTAKYVSNTETFYLEGAGAELSGSVYTQVTDVETELNGFWTYDRREIKVDPAPVREVNRKVLAAGAAAGQRTYPGRGTWSLDGSGEDASGGGSPVTPAGDAAYAPGVRGQALRFDGDGDSAGTAGPVLDTRGSYTVSAWVSLDSLPGNYATAVSQDGRRTENPFYLQYGHGAFAFSVPGGRRATAPATPEAGRWYHLVGVRDEAAGEVRLYVDGRRAATIPAGPDEVSTGPLTIGRAKYAGRPTDYWHGAVDEVRAYGRALGDDEVARLHAER